ncbi:MAG: type I-MYXAN CRISPR-associated endonuclease Cas1 [Deltaproteobacteria bacterium]|nr:type I-MYXAN CRISPR-associated endonuclease Cas1 [Deltaproteobacteria bacterium]
MADTEFEDAFRSHHQAEKTTDEPLIRVMALHALAYCERLFYLEEVEEIRIADANVFSGRRLHEEIDKGPDIYSLELASDRLGIRGKVDVARREGGSLQVTEHKKGKSHNGEAWPSDRLQALAYALLLAEHRDEAVPEAHVRYHADKKTVVLPVDPTAAEGEVVAAVARARELRASLARPPVTASERLCRTCSLAPACLPEEERFAAAEDKTPQRLFPADEDRRIVHVVEQGSFVGRDGHQLVVSLPNGDKKALPGKTVSALVLHGNVQVSTQAIHFCAANEVGVHWLSYGGHYVGALAPGAGGVQRRNRQYQALQAPALRTRLCLRIVHAKVENQLRYLLRATRGGSDGERPAPVVQGIDRIRERVASVARIEPEVDALGGSPAQAADDGATAIIDRIRGHEGMAGREYFAVLPHVLHLEEDDFLYFRGRNRRPPKDPFNSLLSFGYALLYRDCVAALLAVGLEPSLGILHTPRSAAYPLALDLMELFRLILWDVPLIGSVNRKQWSKGDFDVTTGQVWLNADGRRKAVQVYESRKQEKWKHPVLDYSLSYARTIELEARLLEKEWTGTPSLFARLRLR